MWGIVLGVAAAAAAVAGVIGFFVGEDNAQIEGPKFPVGSVGGKPGGKRASFSPQQFAEVLPIARRAWDVLRGGDDSPKEREEDRQATLALQRASKGALTVDGKYGPQSAGFLAAVLDLAQDSRAVQGVPLPYTTDKTVAPFQVVIV